MFIAGDVGGTDTRLGVYAPAEGRPREVFSRAYDSHAYASFTDILETFLRDVGGPFTIDAAAIGVAGPVVAGHATLTNVTWDVSAAVIARFLGTVRVRLLNDLEALAGSVEVLTPDEVVVLQAGVVRADGHGAVIASGTGLGEAFLHRVDGRLQPMASEGGHADFAARTDREVEFVRMMRDERGRVEVEDVICGPGLRNLHRFTHAGAVCTQVSDAGTTDASAAISSAALAGRCSGCVEALAMFVSAYGAEAGNLALRGVATAGVFIGGGIAPKILPALQDGRFLDAFRAKGAMTALMNTIPVTVILNARAGLLGAAVAAQAL